MNNTKDLNIEKEILPFFDFSLNKFSRNKIHEILKEPLKSPTEIDQRQNILKGFSQNHDILNGYSYTVVYLT